MPGGVSLHNPVNGHGPDRASDERAVGAELKPHKIENTTAFMFETRHVVRTTHWATQSSPMQLDYDAVWAGLEKSDR